MVERLYRGKRIDNGEWVYGFYFCMYHDDDREHLHHFIIPLNVPIPKDKPIGEIQVEVDPETVGQYTGLNDKNRKKIFEGDIIQEKLEDAPELLYMVMFKEGSFLAKCVSIDNEDIYLDDFLLYGEFEGIVIGNIHDISELMEGKP